MKSYSTYILLGFIFVSIGLGAYWRFSKIDNTPIWDADAALYSLYVKEYKKLIQSINLSELITIIKDNKSKERSFTENLEEAKKDSRYTKMLGHLLPLEFKFEHPSKPGFIVSAVIFSLFIHKDNALILFTAVCGFLLIVLTSVLSIDIFKNREQTALLAVLISFSPMLAGYSRIGLSQISAYLPFLFFIYFYLKSHNKESIYSLLLSGFFLGLGLTFHPILLAWLVFVLIYELIQSLTHLNFKLFFRRTFLIGLGFLVIFLLTELFQSYLGQLSLLFSNEYIQPYVFKIFKHGSHRNSEFNPFFYLCTFSLYEGFLFIIFIISTLFFYFKRKNKSHNENVFFFFTFFPFIFFSVFSLQFYTALRNLVFILLPAYFLISFYFAEYFKNLIQNKSKLYLNIWASLFVLHLIYASYVNLQQTSINDGSSEIIKYIKEKQHLAIAPQLGHLYLQNLTNQKYPNIYKNEPNTLYFYTGTIDFVGNKDIVKTIYTNVYDHPMYLLEDPKHLKYWFDSEKRKALSRVFFSKSCLNNL